MPRLLNPKVICRTYQLITLAEVKRIIAAGKSKRCAMKDFAVEVEEVTLKSERIITVLATTKLVKPGTYFNVRLEYIL